MGDTDRIHKICTLLKSRKAVSKREFLAELEISDSQFKRDLAVLRDRLNAPIIWDRALRVYKFDPEADTFNLPGLWLNESEVFALLVMEHLLENLQPDLLTPHIEPLRTQVRKLLGKGDHTVEEVLRRIKVLPMAARSYQLKSFETLVSGLLSRKRLAIVQYSRPRNELIEREISPQRLVHYKENWYVDSWCHLRKDIRSFSVDTIGNATVTNKKARNISDKRLDNHLGAGYGIFSGTPKATATLRFTPLRARWVSRETWHPIQSSHFDDDGNYILKVPYSDDRELAMEIMKYGSDVEVLSPKALRQSIAKELDRAANIYKA